MLETRDHHEALEQLGRRWRLAMADQPAPLCAIEPGSIEDYRSLARHHYRAGAPAACVLALRARRVDDGAVIGSLLVSMPTLNAPWRQQAWPGEFPPGKRPQARAVNARLRTISRVVIDPRFRGLGMASALARHYLAAPLTPLTEAIAAMGRWCPFFERAGMRAIEPPPTRRDTALARAIARTGLDPLDLLEEGRAESAIRASVFLCAAVTCWADASRATRRLLHAAQDQGRQDAGALQPLLVMGASRLVAPPMVYAS